MKLLVTGGAGYIGSHIVKQLLEQTNHKILILDNLSTGLPQTIEQLQNIAKIHSKQDNLEFVKCDLCEFDRVEQIISEHKFDGIIHFAASIVVPESISWPAKYYMNNTINTTNLIKCANEHNVAKFIFSSTAAVYGEPSGDVDVIDESFMPSPINPYGYSKLMSEIVLKDVAKANANMKYVIFRYFNVAGADMNYEGDEIAPRIGQSFPDATHLIKISAECASSKRDKVAIFGDDFNTPDGSGIRDYIHIEDLASAHIQAIDYLSNNPSDTFNLGYSKGYSVKEVIKTMQKVTNNEFSTYIAPRRAGDPAKLVADNSKAISKMGWEAKYDDLALICKSAYAWEQKLSTK